MNKLPAMNINQLIDEYIFGDDNPDKGVRTNLLSDLQIHSVEQRTADLNTLLPEAKELKAAAIRDEIQVLNGHYRELNERRDRSLQTIWLNRQLRSNGLSELERRSYRIDPDLPCPIPGLWATKGLRYVIDDSEMPNGLQGGPTRAKITVRDERGATKLPIDDLVVEEIEGSQWALLKLYDDDPAFSSSLDIWTIDVEVFNYALAAFDHYYVRFVTDF